MNLFLLFRSNKTYLKGCALIRLSHEQVIASVTPITPITLTSYRPTNGFIFDISRYYLKHFLVQQIFVDWHEMVNGHRRADNMKHLSLIITA